MTIDQTVAGLLEAELGIPVILSYQAEAGAPRPAATYATVRTATSRSAGAAPGRYMEAGSDVYTRHELRFRTAQVDIWGPGALEIAESLSLVTRRRSFREAAIAAELLIQPGDSDVLEDPQLRDTSHEEHAQAELMIQLIATDGEVMTSIDSLEIDVVVSDPADDPVETIQIQVDSGP